MSDNSDIEKQITRKKKALMDADILTEDASGNLTRKEKKGDLNDFKGDYDGDWTTDSDASDKDLSGDGKDGVSDN